MFFYNIFNDIVSRAPHKRSPIAKEICLPICSPTRPSVSTTRNFLASVGACVLILHIHVVVNWQLSKQGIRWSASHRHIVGSGVDPSRLHVFLKSTTDKFLVFNRSQAQIELDFFIAMFFSFTGASPLASAKSFYYHFVSIFKEYCLLSAFAWIYSLSIDFLC